MQIIQYPGTKVSWGFHLLTVLIYALLGKRSICRQWLEPTTNTAMTYTELVRKAVVFVNILRHCIVESAFGHAPAEHKGSFLDKWLLYPLKDPEACDLLEIAESRHKKASTVPCSQFVVGGWHRKTGDPTPADAICDRSVHDSYAIIIGGEGSMRKRKGLITEA